MPLPASVRVPEIDARSPCCVHEIDADIAALTLSPGVPAKVRLVLHSMELDGLIETQDGDTYRITEKGKAHAALHREGRV